MKCLFLLLLCALLCRCQPHLPCWLAPALSDTPLNPVVFMTQYRAPRPPRPGPRRQGLPANNTCASGEEFAMRPVNMATRKSRPCIRGARLDPATSECIPITPPRGAFVRYVPPRPAKLPPAAETEPPGELPANTTAARLDTYRTGTSVWRIHTPAPLVFRIRDLRLGPSEHINISGVGCVEPCPPWTARNRTVGQGGADEVVYFESEHIHVHIFRLLNTSRSSRRLLQEAENSTLTLQALSDAELVNATCADGSFLNSTSAQCEVCAPECSSVGFQERVPCNSSHNRVCEPCPAGSTGGGPLPCTPCPFGSYAPSTDEDSWDIVLRLL